MKFRTLFLLACLAGVPLLSAAELEFDLEVDEAPPVPQVERIPVAPGPDFAWVGGHWGHHRRRKKWIWLGGHYERHPHGVWLAGHWDHRGKHFAWTEGHWR